MPSDLRIAPLLRRFVAASINIVAGLAVMSLIALPGCGSVARAPQVPRGAVLLHLEDQDNPYLGVACRKPNSVACDRVGLAVQLASAARRVVATVAGRTLELKPLDDGRRPAPTSFEGFLHPAGLRDGPLRVRLRPGTELWLGDPPVDARVRLSITYPNGASVRWAGVVALQAGYG